MVAMKCDHRFTSWPEAKCEACGLPIEANVLMTSIPELIKRHGTIANTCHETGLSELTIAKYKDDTDCEKHVIYNGRLMSHAKCSRVLYSRRGVTKTERANGL